MTRERVGAWLDLPPFDRLYPQIVAMSQPSFDAPVCPGDVPIHVTVKGTRVRFRVGLAAEAVEFEFRYRRSIREWQLFRRDASRWISQGPPDPSWGELLEKLMSILMGAEPSILETTTSDPS